MPVMVCHPPTQPPLAMLEGGEPDLPSPEGWPDLSISSSFGVLCPEAKRFSTTSTVSTTQSLAEVNMPRPQISSRYSSKTSGAYMTDMSTMDEEEAVVQPVMSFARQYKLGVTVGKGSFGTVIKTIDRKSGKVYAVKIIRMAAHETGRSDVEQEIRLHASLDHPNVLKVHNIYEDPREVRLVSDFCGGGDIRRFCSTYKQKMQLSSQGSAGKTPAYAGLPNKILLAFMQQMLQAMAYLRQNNIIHRDIKPENFMLTAGGADSQVKLGDFGFATRLPEGQRLTQAKGTVLYAAPEVLFRDYEFKADAWSLGVTFFEMATGKLPFKGHTNEQAYTANICKGRIADVSSLWFGRPSPLRSLILDFIVVDETKRTSIEDCINANSFVLTQGGDAPACCVIA